MTSVHAIKSTLHRVHALQDLTIGLIMLALLFVGAEAVLPLVEVDPIYEESFEIFHKVSHITIAVLAIGGLLSEKILHRRKHEGVALD